MKERRHLRRKTETCSGLIKSPLCNHFQQFNFLSTEIFNPRKYSCFKIWSHSINILIKTSNHPTHHVISCREPFIQISTRPSRPCTSTNCTHSSACQLHSTLKLHCAFRFSSTGCRLVWCYPSSQRNRAAIKHRSVSWLTLSQDPPQEQEIHLSWQSSDGTTACIKSARSDSHAQGDDKNGNTVSPWFSAWTACRPGMFLWYGLEKQTVTGWLLSHHTGFLQIELTQGELPDFLSIQSGFLCSLPSSDCHLLSRKDSELINRHKNRFILFTFTIVAGFSGSQTFYYIYVTR